MRIVARAAPLGALGGMAFTVGSYGIAIRYYLLKLMGTIFIFILLYLSLERSPTFQAFRFSDSVYIKDELLIVLHQLI